MGMLTGIGGRGLKAIGLGSLSSKVLIGLALAIASSFGGAYVVGYAKARRACVNQNAQEQITALERYAGNVVESETIAAASEIKRMDRNWFFDKKIEEIRLTPGVKLESIPKRAALLGFPAETQIENMDEVSDEKISTDCASLFGDADDNLKLYNEGNKISDSEGAPAGQVSSALPQ